MDDKTAFEAATEIQKSANHPEKVDLHRLTASFAFGVPFEDVTPEQRAHAKHRNFALLYGGSARKQATAMGVSRAASMAVNFRRVYGIPDDL